MATKHNYVNREKVRWTYGAELELADWPRNEPLPEGMAVDHGAYTNVNSNGVAADGPGQLYHLGGEILTAPSTTVDGPADQFLAIIHRWPQVSLNYRMGLNIHVRVPGLQSHPAPRRGKPLLPHPQVRSPYTADKGASCSTA